LASQLKETFPSDMAALKLFSLFHLNLAFSSIEEEQRAQVVERCYWPLLRLAREHGLPIGLEASGFTLETAAALDPAWIEELRRLMREGLCELIGSGYCQVIGPLVPAEVNAANLRLGHQVYERLLGVRPQIALINEQAYSAGMIQHYLDAGYRAIIMEWENPFSTHPGWKSGWKYLPQMACGQHGEKIPVIWNKCVPFQKFQRYAHGEMELEESLSYLRSHAADAPRAFPLYGNDAEVFDFRPGRFTTEAPVRDNEWERIGVLIGQLRLDARFAFIKPSQVLELLDQPDAGNDLHLESAIQPTPVKKQEKYNLTRWAVTGRNDLEINTACWRIYESLKETPEATDDAWRELCYCWSSDFRTHLTASRWEKYRARLADFSAAHTLIKPGRNGEKSPPAADRIRATRDQRFLKIETDAVIARLDCRKGMALDSLVFKAVSPRPLCGTLPHGYYDDITRAADYYTGHLVFEGAGVRKVTDLENCEPATAWVNGQFEVSASIATSLGGIRKTWTFQTDSASVGLRYELNWPKPLLGSLRLGHVTLLPEAFARDSLFYATHNGGQGLESFKLSSERVEHGRAVSFLVSASHALGVTGGLVDLGDHGNILRVQTDKSASALVGMISYQPVKETFFYRLAFSAREMDETSKPVDAAGLVCAFTFDARTASPPRLKPN
jgi:hypothetical protein